MNQSPSSEKVIPIDTTSENHAACRQIAEMEDRVRLIEESLLRCASRLHDSVNNRLDRLFRSEDYLEFTEMPEGEGILRLTSADRQDESPMSATNEVLETLQATRQQLEILNETIRNLQVVR